MLVGEVLGVHAIIPPALPAFAMGEAGALKASSLAAFSIPLRARKSLMIASYSGPMKQIACGASS